MMKFYPNALISFLIALSYQSLSGQCVDPSYVAVYSSSSSDEITSAHSEGGAFTALGRAIEGNESDYVLYRFGTDLIPTQAIRISSLSEDSGKPMIHTRLDNGNYVLAGYSQVGGQRHMKVVCFDENTVFWQKRLMGTFESPRAIYATEDGGVLVVGTSETESNGSSDAFAIHFDENGNINWQKGFGDANNEHFYGANSTFDGLHLVVGNNASFSGAHRPVIASIDEDGDLVDYNVYTSSESGTALFSPLTKQGDVYFVGGYVQSGNRNGILVAVDSDFEVIWSKRIDLIGYNECQVSGVGVDQNGDLFVSVVPQGGAPRLTYLKVDALSGELIESMTTTVDIPINEAGVIGGYQLPVASSGMLSVSNSSNSGDFVIVSTNECLSNSDCLEPADLLYEDYDLSRVSFVPGDRILQEIIDVDEFEISELATPTVELCITPCLEDPVTIEEVITCSNTPIEFTFNFEGENLQDATYSWQFEDGTTFNLESPSITFTEEGILEYELTITTNDGCVYTASSTVEVLAELPIPEIDSPVTLCEGEVYLLQSQDYPSWTLTDADGQEFEEFEISTAGDYTFGFISDCSVAEVEISVEVVTIPEDPIVESSVSLCEGDVYALIADDYPDWDILDENGNTFSEFQITSSGIYPFTFEAQCSTVDLEISVDVASMNAMPFGDFQIICPISEDTVEIGFSNQENNYLWENGSTESSIEVSNSGEYLVNITSSTNDCSAEYTFNILENQFSPVDVFATPEITVCEEGQRTINFPPEYGPYTFPNDSVGFNYFATVSEELTFTYSDDCFSYNSSVDIAVEKCLCPVWIPNVFSPDEDGLNDVFRPVLDCPIYDYSMRIYDRWGREIFISREYDTPWRGESPNVEYYAQDEVYFYVITLFQDLDGLRVPSEYKGTVTILR